MGLDRANLKLENLLPSDGVEDADDYRVTCDGCAALISKDQAATNDQLCEACWALCHFTCKECGEEFSDDEMSEDIEYHDHCENCGYSKHAEEVAEIWEQIEAIKDGWDGQRDELDKLQQLLDYASNLK